MERRRLLQFSALALATAAAATVRAAEDHSHHHGHGHDTLADAAARCVARGETCLAHCLDLLGKGDRSIAPCAVSVNEMLAVCGALGRLAAQDAPSLPAIARAAHDVCRRCEEECRRHEQKHAQCRACADACAECAKACEGAMG